LGWNDVDPRNINWRNEVKAWARTNACTGKRAAGIALWRRFKTFALTQAGFPGLATALLQSGTKAIKTAVETAVDKVLQDILKKSRDTDRNLAMAQVANLVAAAPAMEFTPDGGSRNANATREADSTFRRSVRLFVVDPGRGAAVVDAVSSEYKWDGGPSQYVAVMKSARLQEVVDKIWQKVPAGHTVRAIFGALDNAIAPSIIPDAIRLQSDEEVEAFFELICSKPIRIQVILHRDPNLVPLVADFPPPEDGAYFAPGSFDAVEEYDDPVEDSDAIHRNLAGMAKRTFPRTEVAFEERKLKIRKRIKRQQKLLRTMKRKHRAKFPNRDIYDSDRAEWTWLVDIRPKLRDGPEMVFARGVVDTGMAAYDAHLAAIPLPHTQAHKVAASQAGEAVINAQWAGRRG